MCQSIPILLLILGLGGAICCNRQTTPTSNPTPVELPGSNPSLAIVQIQALHGWWIDVYSDGSAIYGFGAGGGPVGGGDSDQIRFPTGTFNIAEVYNRFKGSLHDQAEPNRPRALVSVFAQGQVESRAKITHEFAEIRAIFERALRLESNPRIRKRFADEPPFPT